MSLSGLGDRAHLFLSQRQNLDIRTRLNARAQELASGEASDMVAHLKGDTAPLADLDRRLGLAESYGSAAREAGNHLAVMQNVLDRVEGTRAGLLEDLMSPASAGDRTIAADAARIGFEDIVSALNTRLGEGALFAGAATDGVALASAEEMMDDIRRRVEGAATASDVATQIDDWLDDLAGGFAARGHRGFVLDADVAVTLGLRADDPTLCGLLKAAALGALAEDPALVLPASESDALLVQARDALLSLAAPLTEVRAGLGQVQARVEEVTARHAARATAWGILRNEMTQIDPYATASEVEALRTQLETHYELTSRLSSLNLASYLR